MTARPNDRESRRRPVYPAIAASLVMVAVLLTAGCTNSADTVEEKVPLPATPNRVLTEREIAELTIADAKEQIKKADIQIQWFKGNASTSGDNQLIGIIIKREYAVGYLYTAEEEFSNGNYVQAAARAKDALGKANESLNDAYQRQRTMFR